MTDLQITEAFLYMDYLVSVGKGWHVASRTPTCPLSPRLEEQPFCFLSLGWDALGFFLPQPALELPLDSEGRAGGVVVLTGKGAAGARRAAGRGTLWDCPRDGAVAAGRPLPAIGFFASLCAPRKGLSGEAGVFRSPFSRTPGTIKEP